MCHRSASSDQTQLGLAIAFLEAQCCNMLPHRCLVDVFRSEVARVLRALLPLQENLFLGAMFLEPQCSRLQVSDLAHAPSRSNSICCGSVTCHVSSQTSSHVSAQVLQANDRASSVGQSVPLAFVRTLAWIESSSGSPADLVAPFAVQVGVLLSSTAPAS